MEMYYMTKELAELKRLRAKLRKAVAHSKEAIAIGKAVRIIEGQAFARTHTEPMPAWMRSFGKKYNLLRD